MLSKKDRRRLDRQFDRLRSRLPSTPARFIDWLRRPSSRWVRLPLGVLLVIGGILSFLPVLGIWMLPLGLLLLALDIPVLQRPMGWLIVAGERKWKLWRRRKERPRQFLPFR